MALAIQVGTYLLGLTLEILAVAALLRGPYRRYPFIFAYVIADVLTTALEMPYSLAYYWNKTQSVEDTLVKIYWVDELILHVMVFALVISMIYAASTSLQPRKMVRLSLIGGAVLFATLSFAIHCDLQNTRWGEWMTPWSRDLNFCAAILDLALWALLIASRQKDHRLLMVSGALGINFTGEAIGGSLRYVAERGHSHTAANVGDAVLLLTNLAFLYILWQTFRVVKSATRTFSAAAPPTA